MAQVVLENLSKVYPGEGRARRDRGQEHQPGDRGPGIHGPGRPVGLRQVDHAAHDRRPGGNHRGHRQRSAASVVNDVLPKDRDIAMVFQNYALYPHMTVYENMAFGLKLRKFPKAEIDARVREAARCSGLEPLPGAQAEGALRRPAPARRPRPRDRAQAEGVPLRRAALEPRRQDARLDAHGDLEAPRAPRRDDDLRDARPGRGDDDGRPDLRDEGRRHHAGRRAARTLQPARTTSSSRASSARRR